MPKYNFYGLGNALVDTEYRVSQDLLLALGVEKGMMTLIDSKQLSVLEEKLHNHAELKKQASGGSAANSLIAARNFGSKVFTVAKSQTTTLERSTTRILSSQVSQPT